MSFFELTLLAGLALGGLVGSQFWRHFDVHAFSLVALAYVFCALILFVSAKDSGSYGAQAAVRGLFLALKMPSVRSLAPVWLCVNAVVGLWLGPTLPFLLTAKSTGAQYLNGIFTSSPTQVGWLLLGYSIVFGTGVLGWSFVLARIPLRTALRISLTAMLPVCVGLFAINHSAHLSASARWSLIAITALLVMVESGFTPAALAWLAQSLGSSGAGKGASMGIYSVLLSLGAIGGSLLAGVLGKRLQIDGLLLGTVVLAICALLLLHNVTALAIQSNEEQHYEHV